MPTASQRASSLRFTLVTVIAVVWLGAFAVVGLGSDGLTAVCNDENGRATVPGYTWVKDHTNACAWTLYSGTFPIRHEAPGSVYRVNGFAPPDQSPMLEDWQIVVLLVAIATTGVLGLAHERLDPITDDAVTMMPAHADAG